MEGLINEDDESNDEDWRSWDNFEDTNGDRDKWDYENKHDKNERHELCGDETHELPVCQIRRFVMTKYSFRDDKKYIAIKEDEYDDSTRTNEEACRAYQEIFRMIEEGWMDLKEKKSTILVKDVRSGNLEVFGS
ncbi:hypothetical protein Tco_1247225 [Tanacetum coccineum]